MPSGVYVRNEIHLEQVRNLHKFHINPPWNKGKKGYHIVVKNLRKKGYRLGLKHRKNISLGRIGITTSAKGKPWSKVRREAQQKIQKKFHIHNNRLYVWDWNEIRKKIYERDNWTCQECGIKCHNNIKINCHHIDYDTTNNNCLNLIALCKSCHLKSNFRREDWRRYFVNKLHSRFN